LYADSGVRVAKETVTGAREREVKKREKVRGKKNERSCAEKEVGYT
jgi:hypothetical protein